MITPPKYKLIQELISSLTKDEMIWLNGYLEGVIAKTGIDPKPAETNAPGKKITIAYGTESGNSKRIAGGFAAQAKQSGIQAKLVSLDQYRVSDLTKEEYFFTIISTQGEGEPPAAAKKFYDHIHQNGFKLPKLKYGVLALGDTAYPLFCKAGEDVDSQLQKLGGERVVDIQRCDVDFEEDAVAWFNHVLQKLDNQSPAPTLRPATENRKPSGKKIFSGTVLTNINLNDRGSLKQTHHIEIASADVDYKPGDSIGIVPHNPLSLVEAIRSLTGIETEKKLLYRNEETTIHDLLHKKLNIVYLPERVVSKYAALAEKEIPGEKTGLVELLEKYPFRDRDQFEQFIQHLEPTAPRLYSIASSLSASDGEVHLTVGRDSFYNGENRKYGLCSDLLCSLKPDERFDFYVHHNNQFRLPAAGNDIIMIGPGTGIAPFRAFLAERDASGDTGRNWLFFGEQHFESDFLYQTELQQWKESGVLSRLDLAFSRDQEEKIYVQHKIKKQAVEFLSWLDNGATLYVCGAKKMSEDVEKTILDLLGNNGQEYLDKLKQEGRYLKDVY
jgi:sulfite reductase (NADPH) flavoprotein alpha-component